MASYLATLSPDERVARRRQYRAAYEAKHPGRHSAHVLDWQRRNPTKRLAIQAAWYKRNAVKYQQWKRLGRYGLDPDTYNAMLHEQGGACAVCRSGFTGSSNRPCVDHDHATDQVRGILCQSCHGGLGLFSDNIERLEQAIAYLKRQREARFGVA